MAVKRGEEVIQNPGAAFSFRGGDIVLLVGKPGDISKALQYMEPQGEAEGA
jgi:uncharacterized protein with PhoU and TrkA domain